VRPNARTTKYLTNRREKEGGIDSTYLSQERQASVSQACKEFVERVAGRKRHRRMQGREESEVDFVEEDEDKDADEDMADMKYGILATM